jgi:CubicO group peptidase (beta-lactamase class C family)
MTQRMHDDPALTKEIEAFVARVLKKTRVPAISLEVYTDGGYTRVCTGRFSAADSAPMLPEARFRIGSLAKVLISVVALELAAAGRLNLEAPLCAYLPELASTAKGQEIQVRHLLSHTSGYQPPDLRADSSGAGASWGEFLARFVEAPMLFRPGTVFNYHNFDHLILDQLLTRLQERPTLELARSMIFVPIRLEADPLESGGIRVTGHDWDTASRQFRPQHTASNAPVLSLSDVTLSVADLTRLAAALLGNEVSDLRGTLLARIQVVELPRCTQQVWQQQMPASYGYGFARYTNGFLGHPGSALGQCCALCFDPERHTAIAVGLNARALHVRDGIVDSVLRLLGKNSEPAQLTMPPPDTTLRATELTGSYVGARNGTCLSVREEAGGPVLTVTNGSTGARREREFLLDVQQQRVMRHGGRVARVPVCFFREPQTGTPCLMLGWRAYKRI